MAPRFDKILKRSGEVVPYDLGKITDAIYQAARERRVVEVPA